MEEERRDQDELKIEPLHVTEEMTEDPEMDIQLRNGLKKESEEEEEFLKGQPGLKSLDDQETEELHENIVNELKKKGKWEETEEEKQSSPPKSVIDLLSEEDRKALEIGRDMLRGRRKRTVIKGVVGAAVIMLGVFVVSLSSDANRLRMMSVWNSIVGQELRIDINNGENHKREQLPEQEAYEEIENKLGISPVEFLFIPENMQYSNYMFDEIAGTADVFYTYEDSIITVSMYKQDADGSLNQHFDGRVMDSVTIFAKDMDVSIWEINNPDGKNAYAAQFIDNDTHYLIWGQVEKNIFMKMIENICF